MRSIRTESAPAPVAGAPYSQAVATPPGDMIFVSGQLPIDVATGALVEDDVAAQTGVVLGHVATILAEAGAALSDVTRTTVYLVDLSDFAAMNAAYAAAFAGHAPARATIGVSALPLGARVEIDAVAVIASR